MVRLLTGAADMAEQKRNSGADGATTKRRRGAPEPALEKGAS
jgi:hypothetical protein